MTAKLFKARWLVVLSLLLVGSSLQAANPYQEIVERNAFGLKPLVVDVVEDEVKVPVPPANIILTGLAVFEGEKQVYLSVTKPGEKVTRYLSLAEREREEGIEVVKIDVGHERVSIKYNGQLSVLTFEENGAKAMTVAPPVPIRTRK